MRITCRETLTRFVTVDVPDEDIDDEDDLETTEVREAVYRVTDDPRLGWDHEYVTDTEFYEGEHDNADAVYYRS